MSAPIAAPATAKLTTPLSPLLRWGTVWLLCFGMIIAYVDRANLSVALASPAFRKFFALSDADRGTVSSVFFWTYAALQIPAGMLVDRYGVKGPYAILFLTWCLISAATAMVGGFWQLIAIRLLLGVAEALVTPASLRWIRYNVPEQSRGLALGIYMAGTKFGPAIGNWAATALILKLDWRPMFAILGLGGLIWLVPWLLMVRADDRELEKLSRKANERAAMPFAEVMRKPVMWAVLVGTFCYNYFVFFSLTWLPSYFTDRRHLPLGYSGFLSGFSFFGMATVAILAGYAADRMIARGRNAIKVRRWFTIAGFLIASLEIFGAMSDSNAVAITLAIVSLSGLGLATANYWALTQTLFPDAPVGRIAGAQNRASNLAGATAASITGWLVQWTGQYDAPMRAVWIFLLIGVSMYLFVIRERKTPAPATA